MSGKHSKPGKPRTGSAAGLFARPQPAGHRAVPRDRSAAGHVAVGSSAGPVAAAATLTRADPDADWLADLAPAAHFLEAAPVGVPVGFPSALGEAAVPAGWQTGDTIMPGGLGTRGAARKQKQGIARRRTLAALLAVVLLGGVAWWIVGGADSSTGKKGAGAIIGRTQTTLLIQLRGSLGSAVDSALVAHDGAHHEGAVVLIPSQVMSRVPGFGSMPFGQALTVGDPQASSSTLTDLMGVTVDGSWVLTPEALGFLVDDVGGVSVDVDKDVTAAAKGGGTQIVVPAGEQRLNGVKAAAFAAFLAQGETEQSRLARFDAVLTAVVTGLPKDPAAVSTVLAGLGHGSTSSLAASRLTTVLVGLAADDAANATTDTVLPVSSLDTGDGQAAFTLDTAKTAVLVKQNFAGSMPQGGKAAGNRVLVENQVGTPGIGESTRGKLQAAGFSYLPGPNAPGMPNPSAASAVLIFSSSAADIARGNAVAKSLGLPITDVKVFQERLTVADVVAIIGADYKR